MMAQIQEALYGPRDERDVGMPEEGPKRPTITWDISLGSILVVVGMLVSVTIYSVNSNNSAAQANAASVQVAKDLQEFRNHTAEEAQVTRVDVNKRLDAIQLKVENLPTFDLRIARLENSDRDRSTWQSTIEGRLAQLQQTVAVMQGVGYSAPRSLTKP